MDNPEKLASQGTHEEEKQNINVFVWGLWISGNARLLISIWLIK
jgi:hypothetical protein